MARKVTFAQAAEGLCAKLRDVEELGDESASEYNMNQSDRSADSFMPTKRPRTSTGGTHTQIIREVGSQSQKSNIDTADHIPLTQLASATTTPESKFDWAAQQRHSNLTLCDTIHPVLLLTSESITIDLQSQDIPEAGTIIDGEVQPSHAIDVEAVDARQLPALPGLPALEGQPEVGAPCISQAASNNAMPCASSEPPARAPRKRGNPVGCIFMLMDESSSDEDDDDILVEEDVSQCVISAATGNPIPANLACRPKDMPLLEQDGDEAGDGEYVCERIVDEALHPDIYSKDRRRKHTGKQQKPKMWFLLKWKDYELNPNFKDYGGHWEPEESLLGSTYTAHMLQKWKRSKPSWYKGKPIRYPPPPRTVPVAGDDGASWQVKEHKWYI